MKRSCLALLIVAAVISPGSATQGDPPILNDGLPPQVGHHRVFAQSEIPVYRYEILKTYPHDTANYTEALFMHDGYLFEGTGLYGRSELTKRDLESGEVVSRHVLDRHYFGEGAVALGDRIYRLTYLSNTGFTYRADDLSPISTFQYPRQGWGLTSDGESLIMSNGSAAVAFINPTGFVPERYVIVRDMHGAIGYLNELEYVDGDIYANVWQSDYIVRFSAETGEVNGWIDLTGLNPDPETLRYPHVLNGIAYNGEADTLLVTGKNWPYLWHIRLVPVTERDTGK